MNVESTITKLLAKAESSPYPAEQAAYKARAIELITRHVIPQAQARMGGSRS